MDVFLVHPFDSTSRIGTTDSSTLSNEKRPDVGLSSKKVHVLPAGHCCAVGDGGPPWLARLPPDCLRHVLQHLALTPSGGPQLTRIACTCRALRDALAQSHIEISEL